MQIDYEIVHVSNPHERRLTVSLKDTVEPSVNKVTSVP